MYATVENNVTLEKLKYQTSALTNYNILVLDQTLKNNSSVSLINTNVLRSGKDYDANVTAAVFNFNDKKNIYNWNGKVAVSNQRSSLSNVTGYSHNLGFGKSGGRFNFQVAEELANEQYDINDLGILFNNNYIDHYVYLGYKWVKPKNWYNNLYLNINNSLSQRFQGGTYQSFNFNTNINGQLKNLWNFGIQMNYTAAGNDFYEPRNKGRVFKKGSAVGGGLWFSNNRVKKYTYGTNLNVSFKKMFNGRSSNLNFFHRYRFNDKFSIGQDIAYSPFYNNVGFADIVSSTNEIIFSRRKRNTVENSLNVKYNFNKNSGISFVTRHYWSEVTPNQFYTLDNTGHLVQNNSYNKNQDFNLNLFNIDMIYTWQFAAGSFVNIVWKNSIAGSDDAVAKGYFKNLNNTLGTSENNNVSLKILYYLDYLSLKKKK